MRVSADALGWAFSFAVEPRHRDAAAPSLLARIGAGLARALRGQTDRGLADLNDAALADIGVRVEDVPGHWQRDPLLDAARCCMNVPFWPGVALGGRDERLR
jgi:uncharacterized protein YjiS (DUF1127 family)